MKNGTTWKQGYARRFLRAPIDRCGIRDWEFLRGGMGEEDAMRLRAISIPLLTAVFLLLSGCAIQPVQPWEKGDLAKPAMSFSLDTLDEHFTQHIYNSKENASGGYGAGGGGCGCN
jgi:Domain of unknown function (DUF4266)